MWLWERAESGVLIDVVEDVSYGLLVSSCVRLGVVVSVFVVVARRQNCKNKTDKTLLFLTPTLAPTSSPSSYRCTTSSSPYR